MTYDPEKRRLPRPATCWGCGDELGPGGHFQSTGLAAMHWQCEIKRLNSLLEEANNSMLAANLKYEAINNQFKQINGQDP